MIEEAENRAIDMALAFTPFRNGNEAVNVIERRYEYFPARYIRRGRQVEVIAVRRCWTSVRRDLAGRPNEFHHFRVVTPEGTYVLTRDVDRNRWTVAPVKAPESQAA